MFALLHRLNEAHRTARVAGVRFCETCGVSTAAQCADAAYARAHVKALTAGIRL